jgi:hypothetical protein
MISLRVAEECRSTPVERSPVDDGRPLQPLRKRCIGERWIGASLFALQAFGFGIVVRKPTAMSFVK